MEPTSEEWRPVPGYSGAYQVSNLGRVRSVERVDSRGARRQGGVLRVLPNGVVTLSDAGRVVQRSVGRFVWEAFVGPAPSVLVRRDKRGGWDLANLRDPTVPDRGAEAVLHTVAERRKAKLEAAVQRGLSVLDTTGDATAAISAAAERALDLAHRPAP